MEPEVLDGTGASSTPTADELSFEQFEAQQEPARIAKMARLRGLPAPVSPSVQRPERAKEKAAPASEPAEPVQDQDNGEPLSDEEKSRRKKFNDGRRIKDRDEQIKALEAKVAALAKNAENGTSVTPKSEPAKETPPKRLDYSKLPGYPKEEEFYEYGDACFERVTEARADFIAEYRLGQLQANRETAAFREKFDPWVAADDGNAGRLAQVAQALKEPHPRASAAIVNHPKAFQIIEYLTKDDGEALDMLVELPAGAAIKEIEKIGKFVGTAEPDDEEEEPAAEPDPEEAKTASRTLPKPLKTLSGRASAPNSEEAAIAAAMKGDLQAFSRIENARKRANR